MADETNQEAPAVETPVAPVLEMSDEDFLKLDGPADAGVETPAEAATDTETKTDAGEGEVDAAAAAAEASAEADAGGEAETEAEPGAEAKTEDKTEAKPDEKADATGSADDADKTQDKSEEAVDETPATPEDQLAKIFAPFKANGRDVQAKSPEEVIKLMQMGANYTRKMQELQPQRKIVTMLSNNGLLDEAKLSFLIDLEKGDPEAIKKLIKDKGVDVLDIDTSVEPAYKPGTHIVEDAEVSFRIATEELISQDGGKDTITEIHDKWDDVSKQALWNNPSMLAVVHEQRASGAYAQITLEMERQITLGNIPANTPFLEAYTTVGDAMVARIKAEAGQGGEQPGQKQEMGGPAPQPVAIKAAAPKSPLANDDKAKAAAPSKSTPKKAEVVKNPLSQSDEDFLKEMAGRV